MTIPRLLHWSVKNEKNGMNLKHAVNEAIDECIHQDIMADFLRRNRAEVVKMSIYEYDEEKNYKMLQGAILEYGARAWQK